MEPVVDAAPVLRPWLQFQTHPTMNDDGIGVVNVVSLPLRLRHCVVAMQSWIVRYATWRRTAMLFSGCLICMMCAVVVEVKTDYAHNHQSHRTCATLHDCMEPIRQGKNELGLLCIEAHVMIETPNWVYPKAKHGCTGFGTYCDVSDSNIGHCGRCEVKPWIRRVNASAVWLFNMAFYMVCGVAIICTFVVSNHAFEFV